MRGRRFKGEPGGAQHRRPPAALRGGERGLPQPRRFCQQLDSRRVGSGSRVAARCPPSQQPVDKFVCLGIRDRAESAALGTNPPCRYYPRVMLESSTGEETAPRRSRRAACLFPHHTGKLPHDPPPPPPDIPFHPTNRKR